VTAAAGSPTTRLWRAGVSFKAEEHSYPSATLGTRDCQRPAPDGAGLCREGKGLADFFNRFLALLSSARCDARLPSFWFRNRCFMLRASKRVYAQTEGR
jgi:hypothetical protein